MKRRVYIGLALLAAVVVYLANRRITAFMGDGSGTGALWLFVALPLAAILTRPVILEKKRGRERRAIGLLYALRTLRFPFFLKSIGWWVLFTGLVAGAITLIYREAELNAAEAVSNWWYVTNFLVLLVHLVPDQFRLPARRPVTIVVFGARESGKSSFIGLLAIEKRPPEWSVQPSDAASKLLLNLHARATGNAVSIPKGGTARLVFTRPGPWAVYTGVRPAPVDFVEVDYLDWRSLPNDAPRGLGIALAVPATGNEDTTNAEVQRLLRAVRTTEKMTRKGRIVPPVAVLLAKCDLASVAALPKEAREALEQNCRKWAAFPISDRGGEPSDTPGFSPKGNLDAALWLLRNVK